MWELCWRGLAAGDRNGGPVRLAILLHQSIVRHGFQETTIFTSYSDWILNDGFDTGPTLKKVVSLHRMGLGIEGSVRASHRFFGRSAGIGPAHRSAPLLLLATGEELSELAMREAQLSHLDPIAGQCSAISLLICEGLLNGLSLSSLHSDIKRRFGNITIQKEHINRSGYAPDVLAAAWYFLRRANSFSEALQPALEFAGKNNYCPVLVGLWSACRFGVVPDQWIQHSACPSSSTDVSW